MIVFQLDYIGDPLELGQQALAGACPLLEVVTRELDRRFVDLVLLDREELHLLLVLEQLSVQHHVVLDEPLYSEEQHLQGFVEAFLARGQE